MVCYVVTEGRKFEKSEINLKVSLISMQGWVLEHNSSKRGSKYVFCAPQQHFGLLFPVNQEAWSKDTVTGSRDEIGVMNHEEGHSNCYV